MITEKKNPVPFTTYNNDKNGINKDKTENESDGRQN
jgi:hypothetical protein